MKLIDLDELGVGMANPAAFENRAHADGWNSLYSILQMAPVVDAEPVRHGRWMLKAHDEIVNYRWNVTAQCSECCDEKNEIWAGFFPGVPDWLAEETALSDAKKVKLSYYCPNCGAKMNGGAEDE